MPHGSTSLVLNLPAGHSSLLQVRYGFGPVHDDVDVATTEGPVLRVDKEEDLDLGDWLMFFLYPQRDDAYGAAIVVLALLTIPLWVPIKYLNTYTLVNRAVGRANQLDTAAEWDEVYSRIKFSLKDKFDSYRIILAKPASTIGSDALFDFVRASLVLAYQGGVGSFENERQLRMTINRSLLSLASI
jgi:hypothetical protein